MLKIIDGYFTDENNNKWSIYGYNRKSAEKVAKTLINCSDCTECWSCWGCDNCGNCKNCKGCKSCIDCTNCKDCAGFTDSEGSDGCYTKQRLVCTDISGGGTYER